MSDERRGKRAVPSPAPATSELGNAPFAQLILPARLLSAIVDKIEREIHTG